MLVPIGVARECLTTSSVRWGGGGEGLVVAFTDTGGCNYCHHGHRQILRRCPGAWGWAELCTAALGAGEGQLQDITGSPQG